MFWIILKYKYENVFFLNQAKPACLVLLYHMGNFIVIFSQMQFSVIACKLFGVAFVGA